MVFVFIKQYLSDKTRYRFPVFLCYLALHLFCLYSSLSLLSLAYIFVEKIPLFPICFAKGQLGALITGLAKNVFQGYSLITTWSHYLLLFVWSDIVPAPFNDPTTNVVQWDPKLAHLEHQTPHCARGFKLFFATFVLMPVAWEVSIFQFSLKF